MVAKMCHLIEPLKQAFIYDGIGGRESIKNSSGAVTKYTYDAKNRHVQDSGVGLKTHTFDYTYDSRNTRLTSSETGTTGDLDNGIRPG